MLKMKILGVLIALASLGIVSCNNKVDLSAVAINGAVYASDIDAGTIVDITQHGSAFYNLSPTVNDLPAMNQAGSQRYMISPFNLPIVPKRQYTMSVEIDNQIFADSVTLPGDFKFNTASDTLYPRIYTSGTITWSRSDSLAHYYVELVYITNVGSEIFVEQTETLNSGYQTAYDTPLFDAYGVYRLDVYSYHNGIYHPDRGQLVPYSTPNDWIPSGAWTGWIKHSLYFLVL